MRLARRLWTGLLRPMLRRPPRLQVAALCHRGEGAAREMLVITSRGTRRWVLPKGWPIRGLDAAGSALQEAWEEAGVRGRVAPAPIGSYTYRKRKSAGWALPVETLVYPVAVEAMEDSFPEAGQRTLRWVPPREAAQMVDEPSLRTLLEEFGR
ncbi:NUDIX hydrolase [Wenxinia marina]|uniref:NUDIX domain protein n=1 Tax=Wenxinia marina DSM 24838 TaxID=1123501 RepID=A0A0D0Q5R3_9RHOB|nr:NUDIX hydrolase [Wenxinia marina]KIQ69814.1 NUDIX domain protein [Wenxinia marina DSM 24838]GGL61454.1 NUDIX hydrolase [Wenxinia marina]